MVQVIVSDVLLETPKTLRVRFRKTGALQYISHLDLMRTMTRVMARAHLPIRYTNGFNPKPHLVFSAPLPVGAQSPREYVDVTVLKEVDLSAVVAALNEGLPPELAADAAYYATTPFSAITEAEYEIRIRTAGADAAMADACRAARTGGPVVVLKKTKSGDKDVDVSPAIREVTAAFDESTTDIVLTVFLRADSGSFLNPDYLMDYLRKTVGILQGPLDREGYSVWRRHLLMADGHEFA